MAVLVDVDGRYDSFVVPLGVPEATPVESAGFSVRRKLCRLFDSDAKNGAEYLSWMLMEGLD